MPLPQRFIVLQGVTADINAKDLFFEGKLHLLFIFSNLRIADSEIPLNLLRRNIKKAHLTCHSVFGGFCLFLHDAGIHRHHLLARNAKAVKGPGLNEVFHHATVNLKRKRSCNEILQIAIFSVPLSFLYYRTDYRLSYALYGRQGIPDRSAGNREAGDSLVDVRRQQPDVHLAAGQDVRRHLGGEINDRCQKRGHELCRIVELKPCRLVCHDGIAGCMRFIKRILGKVNHRIVNVIGHVLRNTAAHAPRHLFLRIALDKIAALLLHDMRFFLAHGAAHKIRASQRISAQLLHNLHHLLLVYDAAVRRLQYLHQLTCIIGDAVCILLARDVFGNEIHRPRPVQCNTCDNILQAFGLQAFHEALHSRRFQLEYAVGLAG